MFEVMNPALPGIESIDPIDPVPALPAAPQPPGTKPTETTSRKQRDAMLSEAGLGEGGMPIGIRYSLAFLTGPQASTVRVIGTPVTVIGREEGDVIINDPEISRRHARIEIHADGTAWLTDLDSTNGTCIDGKTIEGSVELLDRQEFSCGKSTFMLLIRTIDHSSMD
jgi:hypothetical protein